MKKVALFVIGGFVLLVIIYAVTNPNLAKDNINKGMEQSKQMMQK